MAKKKAVKAEKEPTSSEMDFSQLEDRDYRVHFKNGSSSEFHGAALRGGQVHFNAEDFASIEPVSGDAPDVEEDEEENEND